MKKKLSVGTAVAIAVIVAVLTFQITYITMSNAAGDRYSSTGDTSVSDAGADSAEAGDRSEFLQAAIEKLEEIDTKFRELYIGELDEDALTDYILKGYIAGTGDLHAAYYNEEEYAEFTADYIGELVGIGVNVIYNGDEGCIEIINVMPDSPALDAGLQAGDLIVTVGEDKEYVADIGYMQALYVMKGEEGTTAYFSILRPGESELREYEVPRKKVEVINIFTHVCSLDPEIGVIKLTSFDANTPNQFKDAVAQLQTEGCTSFIVDLRYNPGGELNSVVTTLDYLLPEGPIIRIFDGDDNLVKQYDSDAECVDLKMAILVNGSTASAAELFTSAMMDYDRAVVVGETTYGKGSMQTTLPLDEGGALSVTYRMYKPPFSEGYHGVGITPDKVIPLDESLKDKNIYKITDEEDNQMRAAVEALQEE